jgi:small subunit ribosomal protein S21
VIEIKLNKRDSLEKVLRRFKKQLLREGVIQDVRKRRYYEKPSMSFRLKSKKARFEAMLKQRHADD